MPGGVGGRGIKTPFLSLFDKSIIPNSNMLFLYYKFYKKQLTCLKIYSGAIKIGVLL
jgi:hypothetical protein